MDSGIVRRIDNLGRVVIPAETRRLLNIAAGDELAISANEQAIVIRKLESTCLFCGIAEALTSYKGRGICSNCHLEIRHL